MKVELLRAWPRRFERVELDVPPGTRLREAVDAAGWSRDPELVAYAIFGNRVEPEVVLREGDRIELLRPLLADPKEARRQRVEARRQPADKSGR